MNITIFSQHFWPENFRINDFALALKKKGLKINIFTGKPNYPDGKIKKKYNSLLPKVGIYKGLEVLRFPILPRRNSNFTNLFLNYLSYIISLSFYSIFFKKKFGDIFFVYGTSPIFQTIPAIIIGKLFRKPVVLWLQDLWPHNLKDTGYVKNNFLLNLIGYFVNKIYNHVDLILCQSESILKEIKKQTNTKMEVLYNPSNYKFDFFKKKKSKKFYDIYYTGNLGLGQNLEKIINTFNDKEIAKNKIRFFIYGGGKNYFKLKKKNKRKKNKKCIYI